MPISLTSLVLHVNADTGDAERGLDRVHGGIGRMGGLMSGTAIAMTGGLGLIAGGVMTAASSLGGFIRAAADSQTQTAAMNAVLKSTHGAAGMTAQSLTDLASKTLALTGIDDDVVVGAENMLLTFTNIGKKVFPDTVTAVTNVATAMNHGLTPSAGQLQTTSIQLGKALNDPLHGLTALQKIGVSFSAVQKQNIADMIKHGNIAGAQGVILKELGTEFGGAAAAAGQTFAGQMAKVSATIGNVKESIGGALLPVLSALLNIITPLVAKFADFVGSALTPLSVQLSGDLTRALKVGSNALVAFREATKGLNETLNWIGGTLRVAFISTLIRGGLQMRGFGGIFKTVTDTLTGAWQNLLDFVKPGIAWGDILEPLYTGAEHLGHVLGGLVLTAMDKFNTLWAQIAPSLAATVPYLIQIGQNILALVPAILPVLGLLSPVRTIFMDLLPVIVKLLPVVAALGAQISGGLVIALRQILPPLQTMVSSLIDALEPAIAAIIDVLGVVIPIIGGIFVKVLSVVGPIIAQLAGLITTTLVPIIKQLVPVLIPVIQKIGEWIGQLADILMPLISALGDLLKAVLPPVFTIIGVALQILLKLFQFIWPTIQAIVTTAINIIRDVIKVVIDAIHGNWSGVWNDILHIIGDVWNGIWNIIGTLLKSIWDVIVNVGKSIFDAMRKPYDDALNSIKLIWKIIQVETNLALGVLNTVLTGAWTLISNAVIRPFEMARDAVATVFKGLANFAIGALNNFAIHGINDFINRIATAVDWVTSKLNIGKPLEAFEKAAIIPNIPTFHRGGDMQRDGLAIVGGAGAEELVVLPKGAKVIPQSSPLFSTHMLDHLTGGGPGDSTGSPIPDWLSGAASVLGDVTTWFSKGADWLVGSALKQFHVDSLDIPLIGDLGKALVGDVKTFISSALTGAGGLTVGGIRGANFSEFHGFNGDCGETAELIALNFLKGTSLTAANLNNIVHRDQARGWASSSGVISVGNIMRDLAQFEGMISHNYNGGDWRKVFAENAGRYPVITLYANAGRLPGDEPGVQWHYNTMLESLGNGQWAFGDGDNRLAGSGRLNVYSDQDLINANPRSLIVVGHADGGWITEPVLGVGLRTGTYHSFAENGPELVVNQKQLAARQDAQTPMVINVTTKNEAEIARSIVREQAWQAKLHGG